MKPETGFARVNGTRLYYEVAGSGHPLVFIHGFSLDTRMWDEQFEVFARDYRVVRYDLRGFGQSGPPDGTPFFPVDDLRALMTHLEIGRAHLVGLSLGGWVATNFALAYPGMVGKLVLADSVLLGMEWSKEYLETTNPIWEVAGNQGVEIAKKVWLETPLFSQAMRQSGVAERIAQMVEDYSGYHFLQKDGGQAAPDVLARLETISVPTLVMVGEHDVVDFHRIADILLKIPRARKIVLAGAGHMSNMEAPGLFNRAVVEFLKQ